MSKLNRVHLSSCWRLGLFIPSLLLASALNGRVETVDSVAQAPQVTVGAPAYAQAQIDWAVVERDIVAEHNRVRQDPRSYIPLLQAYLDSMNAQGNIPNGCGPNCTMQTQEGRPAVQEAIDFLQRQAALGAVTEAADVAQAAKSHAQDQAGGATGHAGSDGSSPSQRLARFGVTPSGSGENIAYGPTTGQDVVMQLIIDDGVPNRGHRVNIFNPNWTHAGAGCGPHSGYRTVCVINYITANSTWLRVVNNGEMTLETLQMNGANLLGAPLAPGQSRQIELDANQCRANAQVNIGLQLSGGGTASMAVRPCGGTVTLSSGGGIRFSSGPQ